MQKSNAFVQGLIMKSRNWKEKLKKKENKWKNSTNFGLILCFFFCFFILFLKCAIAIELFLFFVFVNRIRRFIANGNDISFVKVHIIFSSLIHICQPYFEQHSERCIKFAH